MRFQKRSVRRIARKGYLVKAMLRCFCLPAKRCTFDAMSLRRRCAYGVIFARRASYSSLKRREFDEIVVFSAGSENPSVRVAQLRF